MSLKLDIHKPCSSYSGMKTFSTTSIPLKNEAEFKKVKELCQSNHNVASRIKASFIPIRTDKDSYLKDLFFPTLIASAIKAKNISNVCFIFIAMTWDIMTLPARIVTSPLRFIYNAGQTPSTHPLATYLKGKAKQNPEVAKKLENFDFHGRMNVRVYATTESQSPEMNHTYEHFETDGKHQIKTCRGEPIKNTENAVSYRYLGSRYKIYLSDREMPSRYPRDIWTISGQCNLD